MIESIHIGVKIYKGFRISVQGSGIRDQESEYTIGVRGLKVGCKVEGLRFRFRN